MNGSPQANDASRDIRVLSSKGEVVTYAEHCARVEHYFEEIKEKALAYTQANASLSYFIRNLKLTCGDIVIQGESCKYHLELQKKIKGSHALQTGRTSGSVMVDESGHPLLYYSFFWVHDIVLNTLIFDYFLPRLVKQGALLRSLIKQFIVEDLRWIFTNEQRQGRLYEMTFERRDLDEFWLVVPQHVKVLLGKYADFEEHFRENHEKYAHNELLLVDTSPDYQPNREDAYRELLKRITAKQINLWTMAAIGSQFVMSFRANAGLLSSILALGVSETYRLGEVLSNTMDYQDQLIQDLRKLEPGANLPHEEIVETILTHCFRDEFEPFTLRSQATNRGGERRRDFIIQNSNPKMDFWRVMKIRSVDQILFDAKNYKGKLTYDDVSNSIEYLRNHAFGNFIIIISRHGMGNFRKLIDAYLAAKQVVLVLTDEDLVSMVNLKKEGKSPTSLIEQRYYEFCSMV